MARQKSAGVPGSQGATPTRAVRGLPIPWRNVTFHVGPKRNGSSQSLSAAADTRSHPHGCLPACGSIMSAGRARRPTPSQARRKFHVKRAWPSNLSIMLARPTDCPCDTAANLAVHFKRQT